MGVWSDRKTASVFYRPSPCPLPQGERGSRTKLFFGRSFQPRFNCSKLKSDRASPRSTRPGDGRSMKTLVRRGSQFIIATRSPIAMTYPEATIHHFGSERLRTDEYAETAHYEKTRMFLERHEAMLRDLLKEEWVGGWVGSTQKSTPPLRPDSIRFAGCQHRLPIPKLGVSKLTRAEEICKYPVLLPCV
jgi:hypothetical protein